MEHLEADLQKYDDLAHEAMGVLGQLPYESQERLLHHLFLVAAHVDRTDDRDAALQLCKDLMSTIQLHRTDAYHKAALGVMEPTGERVSIEEVLARLR